MNKAYTRINFQNSPSTATPLNATNLNKIDKAVNDIDNRVIELAGYQEEAAESAEMASASASAAAKAAETATADAEARVNEVIQGLEVYTKADSHKKFASVIKQVATGSPILITDSSDATAIDFKGKGRSTQKIKMIQGYYDSLAGTYATNANAVCNEKPIPCKTGDNIAITIDTASTIIALFYNGNTFVSASKFENATQATFAIPSNANYYNFDIIRSSSVTPQTVGEIAITVNGSAGYPKPDYPIDIKSVADSGYFDGELLQGYYNESGTFSSNSSYVCSKNLISCNGGDKVKIVYAGKIGSITFNFYDKDMNVLSRPSNTSEVTEYEAIAPTNAKYVHFMFREVSETITPQTSKHITVTINGKYAFIEKSVGNNLFNLNDVPKWETYNTSFKRKYLALKPNTEYICVTDIAEYGNIYFGTATSFTGNQVYTTGATGEVMVIVKADTISNYNVMICEKALYNGTYEPYKEEVKYIPLNEPLRSSLDGSVTDVVNLGECEVDRRFGKFVLNGTENWYFTANTNMYMSLGGLLKPNGIVISDYYVVNKTKAENTILVNGANVIIYDKRFATVDEWKNWLAENNVTLIYEKIEPIVEAIEPVDIVTYDNVTYISNADNAEMEVTYATDTKSYIDSKFAELHAALVNML